MLQATLKGPDLYDNYQENQILTAGREELISLLYNGAIKFCRQAGFAMEEKDWGKAGYNLVRAQRIVHYLELCLDMQAGGEIAKNLEALYRYMNRRLAEANLDKKQEIVNEVVGLIGNLRDAWDQAVVPRG